MRNGEFIKTVWRLQYADRWNDKAPKYKDNSASHSFRVALFGLVATHMQNNRFGARLDVEKVVCRAIFHDLNETVTTSINYFTKKNPAIADIIRNFEQETSVKVTQLLSSKLRPYFYDFLVNAEDDTQEGRMVDAMDTFDSYMFCLREKQNGSSVYFHEKTEELKQRLHTYGIEAVDWLLEEVEARSDVYEFLMHVMSLQSVNRWAGKMSTIADDDAMHTFRVSAIGLWCGYIERIKFDKEVDMLRLAAKSLCHDLVEALTGDVLGPIKHSSPENSEAFERYEREMNAFLVTLLPEELHEVFTDYLVHAKDDTYEGDLVDIADKLDALIKSLFELTRNKEEYIDRYQDQLHSLQEKRKNPCVKFFLAYPLHDLLHSPLVYTRENNPLIP